MGVPALLIALWGLLSGLGSRRDERPASMTTTAGGTGGGVMSRMSAGLDQAQAAQQMASRLPWGSGIPSSGNGTSGQIGKLERLQKLRESGALTDAEFEREKAKVLAEG